LRRRRRGGEGRPDGVVPRHFNVEEERGTGVETHVDDAVEGAWWRRTWRRWRRSGHRQVCGKEITGLGFRGSGTLKKKNSCDRRG
jgi:hypothetical protein